MAGIGDRHLLGLRGDSAQADRRGARRRIRHRQALAAQRFLLGGRRRYQRTQHGNDDMARIAAWQAPCSDDRTGTVSLNPAEIIGAQRTAGRIPGRRGARGSVLCALQPRGGSWLAAAIGLEGDRDISARRSQAFLELRVLGSIAPRPHIAHGRPSPAQASRPVDCRTSRPIAGNAAAAETGALVLVAAREREASNAQPRTKIPATAMASRIATWVADRTGALGQIASLRCEGVCERGMDASPRFVPRCLLARTANRRCEVLHTARCFSGRRNSRPDDAVINCRPAEFSRPQYSRLHFESLF